MSLYTYRKAPIKVLPTSQKKEELQIRPVPQVKQDPQPRGITLWDLLSGAVHDFNDLLIKSKFAGFIVPALLIIFGISVLYNQFWPEVEQRLKLWAGYYDTTSVALVAGDYIEKVQYLSNPGAEYFKKLNIEASQSHILKEDPISIKYRGTFSLSISSLGLNNLPVIANVDSGNDTSYREILNTALGHFKGTGLPISPIDNNIVIYGHSSSGDYYERSKDVAGAFSRLNKIKVGDLIDIEMEGKKYTYRVAKSKIVGPNDISIITGTPNKPALTLFTCFPNGNSAQRFVVIANPVN